MSASHAVQALAYYSPGTFSDQTRLSPRLIFLESYINAVGVKPGKPSSSVDFKRFYMPNSIFHNADGVDYVGNETISNWIHALFGPLSYLDHEIKSILEVQFGGHDSEPTRWKLYVDTKRVLALKSWGPDVQKTVPFHAVFTVERWDAGEHSHGISEISIHWDTEVLRSGPK